MSIFGEDTTKKTETPRPGEDLYGLSVSELSDRILTYKNEILRLESELDKKSAEKDAAQALFGNTS